MKTENEVADPIVKINDLRVGNLLELNNNKGGIPVEIFTIKYERNGDEWIINSSIPLGVLKGIELTPDILIKAGFETNQLDELNPEEGVYYSLRLSEDKYCDLSFISGEKNDYFEVTLFPYTEQFRYKYVHQLQNLMFAISGEELSIDLNR